LGLPKQQCDIQLLSKPYARNVPVWQSLVAILFEAGFSAGRFINQTRHDTRKEKVYAKKRS
jgi:hypothetical protein